MMRCKFGLALTLVALASPALATDLTFPGRGRAAVVDAAGVLPDAPTSALNRRIVAWNIATGHQLVVVTVPSLQGLSAAEYGYQLGRAWGLGRKGINDGAILLLAPHERKVRIEVGRGLEGDLTDAQSSVILSAVVVPRLKAGDMAGALTAGANAIMSAVPASAGDVANAPTPPKHSIWWALGILAAILAAAVSAIVVLGRAARRRRDEREAEIEAEAERVRIERERAVEPKPFVAPSAPIKSYRGTGGAYRTVDDARQIDRSMSGPAIIAPVIVSAPTYEAPRRRDDDDYRRSSSSSSSDDSSSSWSSSSDSSSSSSSSSDSGSSSGFDSGGGDFGGGGSDSSW